MRKRKRLKSRIALLLSAALLTGVLQVPFHAEAATVDTHNTEIKTASDLILYPVPRNMTAQEGTYTLIDGRIDSDNLEMKAVEKIQKDASELAQAELSTETGETVLSLEKDGSLDEQGYSLEISENGIEITYNDEEGAYYAAVTLYQMMFQAGNELPCLTIENDHPDFQYRGFMVDISRNRMPRVETLKRVIDIGESLKMNQMFLYFESFSYAYSLEEVWAGTEPLTPEQAKEVDNYALSKGITVIPVQNSFGHSYAWIHKYPELGDKPESDVLNIFNPDTQRLLDMIYKDLAEGFSSRNLVICGDETHNIDPVNGKAAEGWKAKFPDRGEPSAADLYLDSMDIINDIAGKDNDRQVMYWADMIVNHNAFEQAKEIMDGAIIMDWGYNETYDFESHAVKFEEYDMPFYVCPGDNSWSTIVGNTTKTSINAENAALAGIKHGAVGYMMTNWGDYGHYQNIITQYPGIAYAGGLSWNYEGSKNAEGAGETAYDAFLNTFVYQDTTNTISQAFSKFANMVTDYGIGGFNESYLATSWTEGAASDTALNAFINCQTGESTMDGKRDKALETCTNIANDADSFLAVLENSDMTADDAQLLYKEFENTARQVKTATDFVSMRLRLYNENGITALTSREEEGDQAVVNLAYFEAMIEQFKEIWMERDVKHLLDSTLACISTPKVFYQGIAGLENQYKPISEDNLFIITPEVIEGQIQADDLVNGVCWANAGDMKPSLVEIYIGDDSEETIADALEKGLFRIVDNMEGVEGKVFVHDTQVANENNLNLNGTMYPFLYFPGIVKSNGVYQAAAKLKYENGSPVNAETILVNGTMVDNLGSQAVIETRPDSLAEFSEPDENGWVTLTYTFTTDDYKAISLDIKPHGSARESGDKLYINNLVLSKVQDIVEDVYITTGHSTYNSINLGDTFEVPYAKSSGEEPIVIELTRPDGTRSAVNMRDKIKADLSGVYRLVYNSSEAKAPLVIIFEIKEDTDNLFNINDENAQGFIGTDSFGGVPYFNPYCNEFNSFNPEKNLIVWGEGAEKTDSFVELLSDVEGANGQVIHTFTKNLQGSHIPLINFSAEVEPGKTYVISSRLKLNRVNMTNFDIGALHTGQFYFSNENTDDSSAEYASSEGQVDQYLTPENASLLRNGDWFYFTKTITVPDTCQQGGQSLKTNAVRFWYSLSALPDEDMQYDLWIDDVSISEVKSITEVAALEDLVVEYATKEADLNLPLNVEVVLNDGTAAERPVIWTCEGEYDSETPGTYTFKGQIGSNEIITNPNNLEASINVVVKEKEKEVNKSLLMQTIAQAETLAAEGALEGVNGIVVENFNKALAKAKEVEADASASQEAVNDAWYELAQAVQLLDFKTDKTELNALIAECEALDLNKYQEEGKEEFLSSLEFAKEIAEREDVLTEVSIKEAIDRLTEAKDALVEKPAIDISILEYLYNKVKDTDLSKYIEEGKAKFQAALENAKNVLAAPESQGQVDEAVRTLNNTYLNLRLKADESILQELKDFTAEVEKLDMKLYSSKSSAKIVGTFEKVSKALENPNLTQNEAEALLAEVETARTVIKNPDAAENPAPSKDFGTSENPEKKGNVAAIPKTGDHADISIFVFVLSVCAVGMVLFVKKRKI